MAEVEQQNELTLYEGGEGAAGPSGIWVKYADGEVDEVGREVR